MQDSKQIVVKSSLTYMSISISIYTHTCVCNLIISGS